MDHTCGMAAGLLLQLLGDYAPKMRRLLLDYKDGSSADRNMDAVAFCPAQMTDEEFVQMIIEQTTCGTVSAISEIAEDGTGRCLYCVPSFLYDTWREKGIKPPKNIKAAMKAVGFQPVNIGEFGE